MSLDIRVDITKNHVPQVIEAVKTHADNASRGVANGIHEKAQGKAPVQTGRLRDGIKVTSQGAASYEVSASSVEGGAEREYAAYNEYGTRYMGAQPFMMPAYVEAQSSDLPQEMVQYIQAIEGAAG